MKVKTDHIMSKEEFEILKRSFKNSSKTMSGRKSEGSFALDVPEYVGLKLTNRCNLRCKHCYQWNENGYHNNFDGVEQNEDLDLALIQKVLKETEKTKARLYIWGGEPLVYHKFDELVTLMKSDKREMAICTNGILLNRYEEEICDISEGLELLIGMEGFQREHDTIRGKGIFEKTIANIKRLAQLKKEGKFKGKISVHTVIWDAMIGKMYDYIMYLQEIGVDMVMLCFPWYISNQCKTEMDAYYDTYFKETFPVDDGIEKSWHSFDFKVSKSKTEALLSELKDISEHTWKLIVRMQPNLEFEEIPDFIQGKTQQQKMRHKCLALSNRVDVNPDGSVVACKFFTEFVMGNLNDHSLLEIWKSEKYKYMRECVDQKLMPICTKCSELHLHGV